MAKLNIECRENGDIEYRLTFAGRAFDMMMIRNAYGAQSYKPSLGDQIEKELGDVLNSILGEEETEELLKQLDDICNMALVEDINDTVMALTEYEEQLRTEARP